MNTKTLFTVSGADPKNEPNTVVEPSPVALTLEIEGVSPAIANST